MNIKSLLERYVKNTLGVSVRVQGCPEETARRLLPFLLAMYEMGQFRLYGKDVLTTS
jgi:hypothetical protein